MRSLLPQRLLVNRQINIARDGAHFLLRFAIGLANAQHGRDAYKNKQRPDFSQFPKRP